MKLYELSDELRAIQDLLDQDDNDGELVISLEERLDAVQGAVTQKVDDIAALIAYCEHAMNAAGLEAARLKSREELYEAKAKRLRKYVQRCLSEAGVSKVTGARFTVGLRNCPASVEVLNHHELADEFWRIIPQRREVNKSLILERFKQGGEIPQGVDIITDRKTLSIR